MKLIVVPLIVMAAGLLFAAQFGDEPRFDRPAALYLPMKGGAVDTRAFNELLDARMTPAAKAADFGRGVASLGAILALGVLLLRMGELADIAVLRTPAKRATLTTLTNLALIGGLFTQMHWLSTFLGEPHTLPFWGLAGMALTPGEIAFYFIPVLVFANIGVHATLRGAALPAPLWARPRDAAGLGATLIALLLLAGIGGVLGYSVVVGDIYAIPFLVLGAYTVLCAHGAALARPIAVARDV